MTNLEKSIELNDAIDLLNNEKYKKLLTLPSFSAIYKDEYKVTSNLIEVCQGFITEFKTEVNRIEKLNGSEIYIGKF